MRIELADEQAVDAVVALLTSQFDEHDIHLGIEHLSEAVRSMLTDPARGAIFVAYAPDPIGIAVLAYTWTLEHAGLVAWLDELFVVTEQRRRGVGRALLQHAVRAAEKNGCRALELEVESGHERAEPLYQQEGFVALSRKRWAKTLGSR